MSLFGQIAQQALGSILGNTTSSAQSPLLQIAAKLLQENGGLEGLLAKFQASGLSSQAASWVGTGQNMPLEAKDIGAAFGQSKLSELATQFGLPADQLSSGLAQVLPQLVDKVTPNGNTQGSDALINQGMALLQGFLQNKA